MVLIGLGANLPSLAGSPAESLEAALRILDRGPARIAARSRLYRSVAVSPIPQPDYVNAVARLETELGPSALLARLMEIEAEFGRKRRLRDEPRTLDLDILDYHGTVTIPKPEGAPGAGGLQLPHPRLATRAFVLLPLLEVAPDWRHPVTGESANALLAACAGTAPMPEAL